MATRWRIKRDLEAFEKWRERGLDMADGYQEYKRNQRELDAFEAWQTVKTAELLAAQRKATARREHAGVAFFKARDKFVQKFSDRNRQRLIDAETTFRAAVAAEVNALEELEQAREHFNFSFWKQEQEQE